jgi:hypothetical protein
MERIKWRGSKFSYFDFGLDFDLGQVERGRSWWRAVLTTALTWYVKLVVEYFGLGLLLWLGLGSFLAQSENSDQNKIEKRGVCPYTPKTLGSSPLCP